MKILGFVFLVIGIISFLGALLGGSSAIGPCFCIALGAFLIYRAHENKHDE